MKKLLFYHVYSLLLFAIIVPYTARSEDLMCAKVRLDDGDYIYCPATKGLYQTATNIDQKKIDALKNKLQKLETKNAQQQKNATPQDNTGASGASPK